VARLLTFGGDNGKAQLDALDTVELEALSLAHACGWEQDVIRNRVPGRTAAVASWPASMGACSAPGTVTTSRPRAHDDAMSAGVPGGTNRQPADLVPPPPVYGITWYIN